MNRQAILTTMAAWLLGTILPGLAPLATAQEIEPREDNVRKFMRVKLTHSQKVLEGLALENYQIIAKHAQEMSLLSQATIWQVLQTPQYVRLSGDFRVACDDLKKAADAEKLDEAALAYVDVTLKCIKCHKYVRSVGNARIELPPQLRSGAFAGLQNQGVQIGR